MSSRSETHHNEKISKQRSSQSVIRNSEPMDLDKLSCPTSSATIVHRATLVPGSLVPSDVLQLQRAIGNRAVGRLLARTQEPRPSNWISLFSAQDFTRSVPMPRSLNAGAAVIQRMVQPISYSDHNNTPDPNNVTGSFLGERIVFFRYQRPGISNATKGASDGIADGANAGTYKHYIPWDRIFQKMMADMAFQTRGQIIGYLDTALNQLGIADTSNLDPQISRVEFDSWVTWVMEEIADWPQNIYRWLTSTGDAGGTAVDTPTGAALALMTRLANAATSLNTAIGVVIT